MMYFSNVALLSFKNQTEQVNFNLAMFGKITE